MKYNKITRSSGVAVLTAVIAAVVTFIIGGIVGLLLGNGGLGFGGGRGDGEGSGEAEETVAVIETTVEPPEVQEIEYIDITVSGNKYIYQNKETDLAVLIDELAALDIDKPVKISDDNASQKAYSSIKKALDEKGIRYIEENMKAEKEEMV